MSLGSWDPNAQVRAHTLNLEPPLLAQLIAYSANDRLENLAEVLTGEECQTLSGLMKLDHDAWKVAAENLSEEELLHLIRFLAVAENLPGWEAMEHSPVIPLAKSLRKRGSRLDKDFLHWLRGVNNNRFLPYGPL
jgi:hypothetical protein